MREVAISVGFVFRWSLLETREAKVGGAATVTVVFGFGDFGV